MSTMVSAMSSSYGEEAELAPYRALSRSAVVSLVLGVQLLLQALALDMQSVPKQPIQRRRPRD